MSELHFEVFDVYSCDFITKTVYFMELSALFIDIFMLYLEICVDKAQLIMEFVAVSYLSFEYLPFGVFLCLFFSVCLSLSVCRHNEFLNIIGGI